MKYRQRLVFVARVFFGLFVITLALALLSKGRFGPDSSRVAQAARKTQAAPAKKRLLENRVTEKFPVKVKIKREKENRFRDLENEDWARDLELEVKNIGEKPIYFLYFHLEVPDAKIRESHQNFGIVYGRVAFSKWDERPAPEDVAIKPGETIVLKIEENQLRGWDQARSLGLVPKRIRGARLSLSHLSYGDGTGFEGGSPWPRPDGDLDLSDITTSAFSDVGYSPPPSDSGSSYRESEAPGPQVSQSQS